MSSSLPPRTFRGGEYIPTVPRSGNQGDAAWLVENMILRGRGQTRYWEVYGGQTDLDKNAPLVALTGTLALTADSTTITGTGTLFRTELHLGQRVIVLDTTNNTTHPIFVKRIVSDTEYECWRAPLNTISGQTGYRMAIMGAVNDQYYTMLWGKLLKLDRGSILSVGNGIVRIDGDVLPGSSLTATANPQISIPAIATGNYSNYLLGMDTPTGVTAAAVAGGTKGMRAGNYSLVVTPNRTATEGYNNPSLRVDVTLAANDKVRVTFPAMHTARGQTAWGVWVTPYAASLGADLNYLNGPWHFYQMITDADVAAAGGTFDFEWYDAEIEFNEIVSFNNDAPPQAEFVEQLGGHPVWISCRGQSFQRTGPVNFVDPPPGPFIAPAKPNNIEAAPADIQFSTSPPETIIGSLSADGRIYLMTPNNLEIAQSTPNQDIPVIVRPFWKDGFTSPDQLIFVNGNLYGYTNGGPSRSVGDGDVIEAERDWAAYVEEVTDGWYNGHVLVAYHPGKNAVCFFHSADELNDQGFWTTRVLMYGLGQQTWIGNVRLDNPERDCIVSGVATVGEKLYFTMGGRRIA